MIRLATLEDAKGIAKVHVQSWKETYTDIMFDVVIISKSIEDRKNLWEVVLKDIHQRVWVYENDGKILGFLDVYFAPDGHEAELRAIYILKSEHGKGIGRQFLGRLFGELIEKKYKNLAVYVLDKNPSRYFYETMGAKFVSEEDASVYGTDLKEWRYEWDLSS